MANSTRSRKSLPLASKESVTAPPAPKRVATGNGRSPRSKNNGSLGSGQIKHLNSVEVSKVTGARFSGVKHSGLLAADDINRKYPTDEDLPTLGEKALEDQSDNFIEDYFSAHSQKSVKTSNHTLSKLKCPRMDANSVKSALTVAPCFENDTMVLFKEYRSRFDYWVFLMCKGFNILTYGLGSKRSVLEEFRNQVLSNACHFIINGFFPGLTIKQVLNTVTTEILHHNSATFKTNFEHARFIVRTLQANNDGAKTNFEIYFIIHNIDGLSLRGENAQTSLSILAQSPYIHIVASIDHINAPLLWDQKTLSNFNWSWHDTTTYNRYIEEGSYENCLLVENTSTPGMISLSHVLPSLTPNAQSLFKLLAKHQLSCGEGMSFQELYMKCRQEFLVNSDLALRTHLIEFTDHKLVKSRKGQDGIENLTIPIDKEVLSQFMEQQTIDE